jgi:hypothetical protein
MKVSKWNTVRLSYYIDVEIQSPSGNTIYLTFSLSDETAPWGNVSLLSLQYRTMGTTPAWVEIHPDAACCAALRKFAGDKYSTPADAQRLVGMIASDAAPRGELSEAQGKAWDGFAEAVKYGYAVEIGGAA